VAELDYRVRNALFSIRAIARQTIQHASLEEFGKSFEARLVALSNTRRLLTAGQWKSVSFREFVLAELFPYARDGRSTFALAGDEVQVNRRQALAFRAGDSRVGDQRGEIRGVLRAKWQGPVMGRCRFRKGTDADDSLDREGRSHGKAADPGRFRVDA
jgi:hypothetical protein